MAETVLYLTELMGLKVFDLKQRMLGRVRDAALVPLIDPSRVDRFLVGGEYAWLTVRYDQVRSVSLNGIFLADENLTPYHSDEYMLRMGRDLLDQQIIDAHGRKVVRVTDITFEMRRDEAQNYEWLRLLEVDIGLRSIFRRMLQGVVPPRWIRRLQHRIPPNSIRWEFCSIVEPDPQRRLRLNVTTDLLEQMHPADLADIVEELSPTDREAIFEAMDTEAAADALSEIDPKMQASILESLEAERAAEIIEEMSPDEAADILAELEHESSEEILEEMESLPKTEVRELLEFEEDTAGGMMNTEYVVLHERATVADAIDAVRAHEDLLDELNTVFLIDPEEKLVGSVPLARLFAASAATPLRSLIADPVISVTVDEHEKRVTELFDKYNLLTLPVTGEEGKLVGVITADDVISVLRQK
jgi:magnesium transporter